jgi:hypothetical protein
MIEQVLQWMTLQPDTVGGRLHAQQTAAYRRTDIAASEPVAIGSIDIEIEQSRRGLLLLDRNTDLFDLLRRNIDTGNAERSEQIDSAGKHPA